MPVDPVCGIELDEQVATVLEHQGTKYYFCCEGCKGIFSRKPKKYIKWKKKTWNIYNTVPVVNYEKLFSLSQPFDSRVNIIFLRRNYNHCPVLI